MRALVAIIGLIGLTAATILAQEEPPASAAERLHRLEAEWRNQRQKHYETIRRQAAESSEEGAVRTAIPMFPPVGDLIERAEKEAGLCAKADDAVPFWLFALDLALIDRSDQARPRRLIETLCDKGMESVALARLPKALSAAGNVVGREFCDQKLALLEAKSPHPQVRAAAIVERVRVTMESAPIDGEAYTEARAALDRAQDLAKGQRGLLAEIREMIALRETLAVGMPAPDIEGVDLGGKAFKLSDYRGRVILLDFWGDW
ncbi:MAG: hypothetical protein H6807_04090 [Planctomycetes bacterium]|nr:hypothetical protein [Planctomycetota bacterium]